MDYVGRGSIEKLAGVLRPGSEVIVFTRQSIYVRHEELVAPALEQVKAHFFTHIEPNPTREAVLAAQDALRGASCSAIVALGGGSVLDFAKAWRYYEDLKVPLIAIPTTAGTGSEATQFAVIYIEGKKVSLDTPELLPEVAIVDSQLTEQAPRALKASCAMDAYCQAIESYWAKQATAESRELALEAIRLCRQHLVTAVNTQDAAANEGMARAAHLAGQAINISRTTAAHALSYRITSRYGIPHGHAVALSIAGLFQANLSAIPEPSRLLAAMGVQEYEIREHLTHLMHAIGLESSLVALGISDLDDIADSVNPNRLANNARPLSRAELIRVLQG